MVTKEMKQINLSISYLNLWSALISKNTYSILWYFDHIYHFSGLSSYLKDYLIYQNSLKNLF